MKTIRALRAVALAFVTASVVACGSDSSTAPDRAPADLGVVLSEMALPTTASSLVRGVPALPAVSALTPSSCTYSSTSQSFTCPTVTASGITLTRSYTLLSASGTPQSQFDPAATAAVRTNSVMTGTIVSGGSTITLDGNEELTLSGILTGVHVLNGTSLMHMTGTDAGSAVPYTMTVGMSIADLVLPATPAEKWPKSGKVSMDITDSMQGAPAMSHLTMTFNGTSKVAVTMSSGGMMFSCMVDLASQSPTCS